MAKDDLEHETSVLHIDPLHLDKHLFEQPELAEKWLKKLAKARLALDTAKAEQELTEAELGKEIREDPAEYDLEKVTENAIADAVIRSKRYQKAVAKVNDAKYNVDMIGATCTAIEHRKRALEKAVDLFGMEYFSVPRSDGSREAVKEYTKKAARSKTKPRKERDEDDE